MADQHGVRYICANCGYVYDPSTGDPMSGISTGTLFEDLPTAWVCPMCYAHQAQFDIYDEE